MRWIESKSSRFAGLALAGALILAGCSSQGGRQVVEDNSPAGQVASTDPIKVAMITHGAPGNTFWDTIRRGAEEAAAKDNVELIYSSDPEAGRQAQLVEQYVVQGVDGIIVTLAKPGALEDVLAKADEAGIPLVSINSGGDVSAAMGAFAHFGSDEKLAGEAVGERLKQDGKTSPICVIHEQGNVGLEARCEGVKDVIPETENLYVQGTDMTQVASTITAKLQTAREVDSLVALDAPIALTAAASKAEVGSEAVIASFDLNAELAQGIVDQKILFTVDQQPWLQGYLAVDSLWQNHRGGFEISGGKNILTGPAIVDSTNGADVLKFAQEGIR
ncbi:monosaccharide ABC transporter substrate-binding protein (CUT2 family) [Arthrobacter sp. AG1021]|uniref:substrate-binding domain-containing protein n=1 Tax=Arthrobacter sp. AG1021 TaxID=2183908 RepID=UPI000EABAFDE|nr:substrate-binding domain-containing protein [Arthrobacter sp. AG1021]RKS16818.1 monosaccharide ABC transporter substrate-binding protein (CUT2 family) [Arthrobacter sp. AG1021]